MAIGHTKTIRVQLDFGDTTDTTVAVGQLALSGNRIYFAYDDDILDKNLAISPIALPLQSAVQPLPKQPFNGLAGVFDDSLPDGWGRLLFDRYMQEQGISPVDITSLDRLAYVGHRGLGALVYTPDYSTWDMVDGMVLDMVYEHAQAILQGQPTEVLPTMLALNGSSAGARPKALISVNKQKTHIVYGQHTATGYSPWLVKFANTNDGADSGAIEFVYAKMAKNAGLHMCHTHLFEAQSGAGYFAVERFDTDGKTRYHKHTACGLLHADFRTPMLDYQDILRLTLHLTHDIRQVYKVFQMAVFNVLSHNQDDHGKNFSFLMDKHGTWQVSPAYDITYAHGLNGEQSTTVMGKGGNITIADLVKLGESASLSTTEIHHSIEKTIDALSDWHRLATTYGVSEHNTNTIGDAIRANTKR